MLDTEFKHTTKHSMIYARLVTTQPSVTRGLFSKTTRPICAHVAEWSELALLHPTAPFGGDVLIQHVSTRWCLENSDVYLPVCSVSTWPPSPASVPRQPAPAAFRHTHRGPICPSLSGLVAQSANLVSVHHLHPPRSWSLVLDRIS